MDKFGYRERSVQGLLSDSDDSSFVCQENEMDSQSSEDNIFNMETREDSYLENMYQFVSECFNCEQLMARLKVSKSVMIKRLAKFHSSGNIIYETEENESSNKTNKLKIFKKSSYTPKLFEQKQSWSQIIIKNKFSLLFILVSIVMVFLRIQDIQFIVRDKQRKECLKQQPPSEGNLDEFKKCIDMIIVNPTLILFDYHQLFYFFLIVCAVYVMYKNIASNPVLISHSDYLEKYKVIHKITTNAKISLSELLKFRDSPQINPGSFNKNQQEHYFKESTFSFEKFKVQ